MVVYLVLLLIVLLVSWGLTGLVRRYALANSLIDIPNNRSSHSMAVPRGGGVSIVFVVLLAWLGLWVSGEVTFSLMMALFGGGGIVAFIGFMDDHNHIAARWRLLAHFFAAAWVLFFLGGLPPFYLFSVEFNFGLFGYIAAAFYIVWLLNLYNFMDGIDGIASIEAITVCFSASVITLLVLPFEIGFTLALLVVVASSVGFLIWNFPQAKIFMGDAGSGFLGLVIAALSIQAAWQKSELLWCWLILLGVFIVDATLTLARRIMRGEKFYQAHRSHAYQFAARKYDSHVKVSLGVGLVNIFWLFPVALCVAFGWVNEFAGLFIAYVPLVYLAYKLNAGLAEVLS